MKSKELSLKELEKECEEWAEIISKDYIPDFIIYIAKAGYPIAYYMNSVFQVTLVGVEAVREGNEIKAKLGKIFSYLPNIIRNVLIYIELNSSIHKIKSERKVRWLSDISMYHPKQILLVDDSVDTGYSIVSVKKIIKDLFPDCEIRTAGLNVWDKSKNVVNIDYSLYNNIIIKAPMSKDSKYYDEFIDMYVNK